MAHFKQKCADDMHIKGECSVMNEEMVATDFVTKIKQESGVYMYSDNSDNDERIEAECSLMHDSERRLKSVELFKEELELMNDSEVAMIFHPEDTDMFSKDVKDDVTMTVLRQDCEEFASSEMEGDSSAMQDIMAVPAIVGSVEQSTSLFTADDMKLCLKPVVELKRLKVTRENVLNSERVDACGKYYCGCRCVKQ